LLLNVVARGCDEGGTRRENGPKVIVLLETWGASVVWRKEGSRVVEGVNGFGSGVGAGGTGGVRGLPLLNTCEGRRLLSKDLRGRARAYRWLGVHASAQE